MFVGFLLPGAETGPETRASLHQTDSVKRNLTQDLVVLVANPH